MLASLSAETPRRFGYLLIPHFSMMSFTSAIEPFRIANQLSGKQLYEWRLFSSDGGLVMASNDIPFVPDFDIANINHFPTVIVCAGSYVQRFKDKRTLSWLRQLARHGTHIGSICTGSYVLAKAGLLDGYRCTIHWENLSGFQEEFPHLDVTNRLFEFDRDRFTSSGASATFEMMLQMISEHHGYDLSVAIAEQFTHTRVAGPDQPQRMPLRQRLRISHPKLIDVISQMEENLEEPLPREELACNVGLSTRQVERLFKKYLGHTPARHYLELRLKRAQMLLSQTSMPILDVSIACGFVSASHFSKCYREMFARPPRAERAPAPGLER